MKRCLLMSIVATLILASGAWAAAPVVKDAFHMEKGVLYRGDNEFTVQGFYVPDAGKQDTDLSKMVATMARIAEPGGNGLAFNLPGLSADGKSIAPEAVKTIHDYAVRAKEQRMALVIRVLGNSTDPKVRKATISTVAKQVADQLALYWIDGPNAAALAKRFKKLAPKLVVIAQENGDIQLTSSAPAKTPASALLVQTLPASFEVKNLHFILDNKAENYAALDAALMRPEEKKTWTLDPAVVSKEEQAEGFLPLFDGKSLDGWWVKGDVKDSFHVSEDGFIEWRKTGGDALMSAKRYDNFIFRCEWKLLPGGNSGVWFRAPRGARQSYVGFELQMMGDNDVKEFNNSNTGSLYMVLSPLARPARAEGLWNTLEVICQGSHIKATMNGTLIQDVNMDDNEDLKCRLRKGFICLTNHNTYVGFRNIRIKELK
jgi:hypothetical protein